MITSLEFMRDSTVRYCYHVSNRSVQCAIGSKNFETIVDLVTNIQLT